MTTVLSSSRVRLTWTDNSLIETGFSIWRKTGSGDYVRIAVTAPNTTQFTDSGLTPVTSYTYRVRAIGLGGASNWTNEATAVTPDVPPAAPTGLTASAVSSTRVNLAWTDNSANETAFAVWRKNSSGVWGRIALLAPNTIAYADTSVTPGTNYTYRVRAGNNVGVSAWTNEAAVTTAAP
jgi:titin